MNRVLSTRASLVTKLLVSLSRTSKRGRFFLQITQFTSMNAVQPSMFQEIQRLGTGRLG